MSKESRRIWTRDELLLAFNLYCKTPFGKIDKRNPHIVELAGLIDRTPSAVGWKLANFARLDPAIQARGLSGASHGSKGEEEIWNEFNKNWEQLSFESEVLLRSLKKKEIESQEEENLSDLLSTSREGLERETIIRARVNQGFFRETILATYSSQCCITGINIPSLLIASHIVPWSKDIKNRVNPQNGLCLNALHDKAFDRGLITINLEFEIITSKTLFSVGNSATVDFLTKFQGEKIKLPNKFSPEKAFLQYHNEHIFMG